MPNFTYTVHNALTNWLGGQAFPAAPTALYVGLLAGSPNPDGTGVIEPTDTGYQRQPVTFQASQDAGVTTLANINPLVFGDSIVTWIGVNYLALFDQAGNMLMYGRLRTTRVNTEGNSLTFASGAITIGLR